MERFKVAIYFHLGGLDIYSEVMRKRLLSTRFSEEPSYLKSWGFFIGEKYILGVLGQPASQRCGATLLARPE